MTRRDHRKERKRFQKHWGTKPAVPEDASNEEHWEGFSAELRKRTSSAFYQHWIPLEFKQTFHNAIGHPAPDDAIVREEISASLSRIIRKLALSETLYPESIKAHFGEIGGFLFQHKGWLPQSLLVEWHISAWYVKPDEDFVRLRESLCKTFWQEVDCPDFVAQFQNTLQLALSKKEGTSSHFKLWRTQLKTFFLNNSPANQPNVAATTRVAIVMNPWCNWIGGGDSGLGADFWKNWVTRLQETQNLDGLDLLWRLFQTTTKAEYDHNPDTFKAQQAFVQAVAADDGGEWFKMKAKDILPFNPLDDNIAQSSDWARMVEAAILIPKGDEIVEMAFRAVEKVHDFFLNPVFGRKELHEAFTLYCREQPHTHSADLLQQVWSGSYVSIDEIKSALENNDLKSKTDLPDTLFTGAARLLGKRLVHAHEKNEDAYGLALKEALDVLLSLPRERRFQALAEMCLRTVGEFKASAEERNRRKIQDDTAISRYFDMSPLKFEGVLRMNGGLVDSIKHRVDHLTQWDGPKDFAGPEASPWEELLQLLEMHCKSLCLRDLSASLHESRSREVQRALKLLDTLPPQQRRPILERFLRVWILRMEREATASVRKHMLTQVMHEEINLIRFQERDVLASRPEHKDYVHKITTLQGRLRSFVEYEPSQITPEGTTRRLLPFFLGALKAKLDNAYYEGDIDEEIEDVAVGRCVCYYDGLVWDMILQELATNIAKYADPENGVRAWAGLDPEDDSQVQIILRNHVNPPDDESQSSSEGLKMLQKKMRSFVRERADGNDYGNYYGKVEGEEFISTLRFPICEEI